MMTGHPDVVCFHPPDEFAGHQSLSQNDLISCPGVWDGDPDITRHAS
jgi:hypothetical protein